QYVHRCSYSSPPYTVTHTLSLHDALPICPSQCEPHTPLTFHNVSIYRIGPGGTFDIDSWTGRDGLAFTLSVEEGVLSSTRDEVRSEEHTSELQSREKLVCRLLLEKKKMNI